MSIAASRGDTKLHDRHEMLSIVKLPKRVLPLLPKNRI